MVTQLDFLIFQDALQRGIHWKKHKKMATCAIGLYAQNEDGEFEFPEASEPNNGNNS